MREAIILIIETTSHEAGSDKGIHSKPASRLFNEGWERVFGKKETELSPIDKKDLN